MALKPILSGGLVNAGIPGTISDKQVAFGNHASIAGNVNFTFDYDNLVVHVGDDITLNAGSGEIVADQFNGDTAFLSSFLELTPSDRPDSPGEGRVYQDSTDHHLYVWNGTAWKQLDN